MAAVELRCDHVSTTDGTCPTPQRYLPSPPDEARRLQPDTELLVEVSPLQVWRHLCRGVHRGIDRRVALQRGAEFWEVLAEEVQRDAAAELDVSVLRVPPQGSQQRVRRGLRRQTRQRRALQQAAQRVRGLVCNLRVLASALWKGRFRKHSITDRCLQPYNSKHLKREIIKKSALPQRAGLNKTWIQFATPTCDCSLVAFNVMIEITFQRCPARFIETWHGSDRWGNGRSNGLVSTQQLAQAKRQRLTEVQLHP